jgi:small-conductance mechanosensitive channel
MRWSQERSPGWVFVTRMIGIISFLIIVVLANILKFYVQNPVYHSGVGFLNANFWLILLIGIILFIADIFASFLFPLDLPAPVIRAIGSVFIIAFVLRVFDWVDQVTGNDLYHFVWLLSFIVVPIVFILVLATGYYEILRRLFRSGRTNGTTPETPDPMIGTPRPAPLENEVKSWEDVGTEFRMMIWDIIHRFRDEIRSDRK